MPNPTFRVDFMILGAMKCGTTTLADILAHHPDVGFCTKKEPDFFALSTDWRAELSQYEALYTRRDALLYGEASTTYTCLPEFNPTIWRDLYEYNPAMKFIYIMRHPVQRVISHYVHDYMRARTDLSFEKALFTLPSLINRGRYYTQILPYINQFGRERFYFLTFEEFLKNPIPESHRIADFLGLDAQRFGDISTVHKNKSVGGFKRNLRVQRVFQSPVMRFIAHAFPRKTWQQFEYLMHKMNQRPVQAKPHITPAQEATVLELLRLDILKMEELIGRKFTEWNLPY